jgi:polysaccharide biosynthesis/export protein
MKPFCIRLGLRNQLSCACLALVAAFLTFAPLKARAQQNSTQANPPDNNQEAKQGANGIDDPAAAPSAPAPGAGVVRPQPGETAGGPRGNGPSDSALRLGIGDLVEMTVYNVPDLTSKTRVASDGEMYLPLISHVHVAGLTIEEAEDLIQQRLADEHYLKDPHVSLFVSEYASAGASVFGEVAKPGVYPVMGQQHLFDLVSAAGGFTEKAGHSIVVTRRSDPDHPVEVPFTTNLSGDPKANIQIHPGDTIVVRKADIAYVVGDVARPSGFLMDRGELTVMQAVALAGGANRTAKLDGSRIVRKGPTGTTTEVPVKLKQILNAKEPDIALQANDVLVIPASAGKILAGRSLEAAMQAVTLVSVAAI